MKQELLPATTRGRGDEDGDEEETNGREASHSEGERVESPIACVRLQGEGGRKRQSYPLEGHLLGWMKGEEAMESTRLRLSEVAWSREFAMVRICEPRPEVYLVGW